MVITLLAIFSSLFRCSNDLPLSTKISWPPKNHTSQITIRRRQTLSIVSRMLKFSSGFNCCCCFNSCSTSKVMWLYGPVSDDCGLLNIVKITKSLTDHYKFQSFRATWQIRMLICEA